MQYVSLVRCWSNVFDDQQTEVKLFKTDNGDDLTDLLIKKESLEIAIRDRNRHCGRFGAPSYSLLSRHLSYWLKGAAVTYKAASLEHHLAQTIAQYQAAHARLI